MYLYQKSGNFFGPTFNLLQSLIQIIAIIHIAGLRQGKPEKINKKERKFPPPD